MLLRGHGVSALVYSQYVLPCYGCDVPGMVLCVGRCSLLLAVRQMLLFACLVSDSAVTCYS